MNKYIKLKPYKHIEMLNVVMDRPDILKWIFHWIYKWIFHWIKLVVKLNYAC